MKRDVDTAGESPCSPSRRWPNGIMWTTRSRTNPRFSGSSRIIGFLDGLGINPLMRWLEAWRHFSSLIKLIKVRTRVPSSWTRPRAYPQVIKIIKTDEVASGSDEERLVRGAPPFLIALIGVCWCQAPSIMIGEFASQLIDRQNGSLPVAGERAAVPYGTAKL